jgi:hypothetical protein
MKKSTVLIIIFLVIATVYSQTDYKRSRGEGFYKCESANTIGVGNVWAEFCALGFLWDADPEKDNMPEPFAFPEVKVNVGIRNYVSAYLESRVLSYSWKFDWLAVGSKFTFLKNKDIRFQNVGLKIEYRHRFLSDFHTTIGGFQNSAGTGFLPEGFVIQGGNARIMALYDLDFISKFSFLPLKVSANFGVNIPFDREFLDYSQYLINVGVAYIGLGADVFIEYSVEAFFNTTTEPKRFSFNWEGWGTTTKTWEVAFSENPMYLTLGGRVRYPNGLVLYGAVPLLVSQNKGSTTADVGLNLENKFPEEAAKGINNGFDPWYAKWKLIVALSYPIRFKQTGAEMRRSFLLLKNKKGKKRIDIDKRLNLEQTTSEQEKADEKTDRKKRLDTIKKRREEIEKSE